MGNKNSGRWPKPPWEPDASLTAAARYQLLVGSPAPCRVKGWASLALLGDDDSHLDALWAAHRAALTVEASAAGFVPYAESGKRPSGPGYDTWAARFLNQHQY